MEGAEDGTLVGKVLVERRVGDPDLLGDVSGSHSGSLDAVMRVIAERDRGVVIVIREPAPNNLSQAVKVRAGETPEAWTGGLRHYGIGAQILQDLGVSSMILLSNTRKHIVGLDGYGITLAGQEPIPG